MELIAFAKLMIEVTPAFSLIQIGALPPITNGVRGSIAYPLAVSELIPKIEQVPPPAWSFNIMELTSGPAVIPMTSEAPTVSWPVVNPLVKSFDDTRYSLSPRRCLSFDSSEPFLFHFEISC